MDAVGLKWARLGLTTLYAFATLMSIMLLASHAPHDAHSPVSAHARLCSDPGPTGDPAKIELCCDVCQLSGTSGLEPVEQASFLFRHEISTRLIFAQRLNRVADATPDDLRSRAPPALPA